MRHQRLRSMENSWRIENSGVRRQNENYFEFEIHYLIITLSDQWIKSSWRELIREFKSMKECACQKDRQMETSQWYLKSQRNPRKIPQNMIKSWSDLISRTWWKAEILQLHALESNKRRWWWRRKCRIKILNYDNKSF